MTQLSPDTHYEQICEDYRSLNGFLWQIPIIVTTLNGGLWFAVAKFSFTFHAQTDLLRFAAVTDLLMIVVLWRIRIVMDGVQAQIASLDGRSLGKWRFIVVTCFTVLLGVASYGSTVASCAPAKYFIKPTADAAKGEPSDRQQPQPKPPTPTQIKPAAPPSLTPKS